MIMDAKEWIEDLELINITYRIKYNEKGEMKPIMLSDLLNQFALQISEQAVEWSKMQGFSHKATGYYDIHAKACDKVLSRIKTLTEQQ